MYPRSSSSPAIDFLEADLHTVELEADAYDLIFCALVLEYVDSAIVLEKVRGWLAAGGVLVVVAQLASNQLEPITETEFESLRCLAASFQHIAPEEIRKLAAQQNLAETLTYDVALESGKSFYIGCFSTG